MKRIIPILIVIVICISVIPFAVSADLTYVSYYEYDLNYVKQIPLNTEYNINPVTINVYLSQNSTLYSITAVKITITRSASEQSSPPYGLYWINFIDSNNVKISFRNNSGYGELNAIIISSYMLSGMFGYVFQDGTLYGTVNNYYVQCNFDRSFNLSEIGYSGFQVSNSPISSNYTLTFNSNGGSSIAPITDIEPNSTINLVGQFGEYLPQFVPEKEFYEFSGWSLTENGTNVSSVTVTQDTTLYANWVADARNTMIIYDSANGWMNFYGDQNHTTSPPTLVISGNNVSINVFYEITSQVPNGYYLSYFNIEENGTTYRIMPEAFYINIIVDTPGYIQITPVFTQLRTLTVTYNPQGDLQDNTMEFGVLDPAYRGGASVTLTGSYSYPMFITKVMLVGNSTHKIYEIDIQDSWDEQERNFYFEMYFTMPDEDSTITVFWSVMMGYPAQPTVSYDESGNPYFYGIDSEDIFNQDFSRANDLIPDEIIGFIEYFTYFEGLSVIITIILVAGFATYILRHSV